jgi:hypothetical protein
MRAGRGYFANRKCNGLAWLGLHTVAAVDAGVRNVHNFCRIDAGSVDVAGAAGAFGIVFTNAAVAVSASETLNTRASCSTLVLSDKRCAVLRAGAVVAGKCVDVAHWRRIIALSGFRTLATNTFATVRSGSRAIGIYAALRSHARMIDAAKPCATGTSAGNTNREAVRFGNTA